MSIAGEEKGAIMYKVMIADNFHYMGESESYSSWSTLEESIANCIEIVDKSLQASYKPGMTSEDLYEDEFW